MKTPKQQDVYVSIDVEADGPIPGYNSMLSFGAAAFVLDDRPVVEFCKPTNIFHANLAREQGTVEDPDTTKWWASQPEAWKTAQENAEDPRIVMPKFVEWLRQLPGVPVVVGYPATYDFMFLYWNLMRFGGPGGKPMTECGLKSPFSFAGLDIKTLAWTRLGGSFREASKRNMPKRWFIGCPEHNHDALQDAIGQGVMFVNIISNKEI